MQTRADGAVAFVLLFGAVRTVRDGTHVFRNSYKGIHLDKQ